jgi:DNA-binding NarL/FixJ family response regulator
MSSAPDIIRIILADDHLVVRAGLKAVLGSNKDIEVVGEAANGRDAIALVERLKPHVAVIDLDMPQMDGITATKELVAMNSSTRVLILTMHTEDDYLVNLLAAGAAGYLVKSAADRELADAVRAVAAGDTYVQPSAARALAREVTRRAERTDERQRYMALSATSSYWWPAATRRPRSARSCSSVRRRWKRTSSASPRRWELLIDPTTSRSVFSWDCCRPNHRGSHAQGNRPTHP